MASAVVLVAAAGAAQAQSKLYAPGPALDCSLPYCPPLQPAQAEPPGPSGGSLRCPPYCPPAPEPDRRPRERPPIYHGNHPYYGIHPRYYYDDPYFVSPYFYQPYIYDDYDDDYDDDYYYYEPRRRAVRFSCNSARQSLRERGYYNVKAYDCKGKSYGFTATKNKKRYKITISSRTGAITARRRY